MKAEKTNECITKDELIQNIKNEDVLIIDVRSEEEFIDSHIEGAVNIEIGNLEQQVDNLKTYQIIVTTCGKGGGRSKEASDLLRSVGLNANWLCGGTFGWYQ